MRGSELHVRARVWNHHDGYLAALLMEGEAVDRSNGDAPAVDALYRVVLANGLRLTTDLDHLVLQPIPGWHLLIDEVGRVTLTWPHFTPLLDKAPLELPPGWVRVATTHGVVLLLVGYGLGLHEECHHDESCPLRSLRQVAETGALAAGAVSIVYDTPATSILLATATGDR